MRQPTLRSILLLVAVGMLMTGLAFSTSAAATADTTFAQTTDNETSDDWFNLEPSTSIHTPETTITEDQVGIIEVTVSNPSLNDKTIEASVTGSYPSGTSVTGENLASTGGGQFTGEISVQPGSERTIQIRLAPNELSDFTVNGQVFYTHENTDRIDQTNLQRPFTVEGIPDDIGDDDDSSDDGSSDDSNDQDDDDGTTPPPDIPEPSAALIGLVAVVFLGTGVVVYARKSGAEVTIEE